MKSRLWLSAIAAASALVAVLLLFFARPDESPAPGAKATAPELSQDGSDAMDTRGDLVPLDRPASDSAVDRRVAAAAAPDEVAPTPKTIQSGGLIEIVLSGPAAGHPEAVAGDSFVLYGSESPYHGSPRQLPDLDAEGRYYLRGVEAGEVQWIGLDAELFVRALVPVPAIIAGERLTVEVPVVRGVTASGVVLGPDGAPVADARVRLGSWDRPDMTTSIGYEEESLTDEEGRFRVGGVLPGQMTVRVSGNGFDSTSLALGEAADGDHLEGLEIQLAHGGRLLGVVRWPDGAPADKATVKLSNRGQSWKKAPETKTDGEGQFEFSGLGPGDYRVAASARKKRDLAPWQVETIARPGQPLVLELQEGLRITGRVTDDLGQPISDFRVSATPVGIDEGGSSASERVRKGDGDYEITGLGAGNFDLTATSKGHAAGRPVRVNASGPGTTANFTLDRLASAAGIVRNSSGSPLPAATLTIGGRSITTDGEGRFEVEGVPPGALLVTLVDRSLGVLRSEPAILAPGEHRDDIEIVLGAGGTVRVQLHPSLEGGIYQRATLRAENSYAMSSSAFDEEGTATFTGLEAGRYWVALPPVEGREFVLKHRDTNQIPVEVPSDGDVSVVIGDPDAYGITMSGRVTRNGDAQAGLMMYVYAEGTERLFPSVIGRTDDSGRYEVKLREPGPYTFNVGEGQAAQARFPVDVTGEPLQERDFELPDRTLEGRAIREDGSPVVGGMYVLFHRDAPRDSKKAGDLQFAGTKNDGSFVFTGLHPGRYRLHTGNYFTAHETDGLVIVEDIVVPASGEGPEVNVVIPRAATVIARALDAEGRPLADHAITLETEAGSPHHIYASARTDSQGYQRIVGVGPGTWRALVRDRAGQVVGETKIEVAAGAARELEILCSH
ncbi:Nickel uptake substrate-specific transmembrane region [Planctomycetes bacterium Poly30]|uniref:Nickel uptake substrate-specific transmembrane region n=1 Tax=Saltatorellus ferox TaxID=2528018 RepID=A0A518ETU5_9BACT|nr:Nickel uptake substrate-specific transmembrane region [Planctomycetes bacterium Poly30]